MGLHVFLLFFIATVASMFFLCYVRGGMEPILVMVLIGGLGITTLVFLSQLDAGEFGGSRYAGLKYDKLHLNFNQPKILLLTGNTKLARIVGEVLGSASGAAYWDTPFQVCWDAPRSCSQELGTTFAPKLLESFLNCQLRYLAFYQEFNTKEDLDQLVKKCSQSTVMIVRTSRIKIQDVALLKSENPYWKMSIVYLLQDPRARLADMKASARFRNKAGALKTFNKKSYQTVIPNLCSELSETVEYLSGHARIAAGMKTHSLRHEDVLLDLDQEVRQVLRYINLNMSKTTENMIKKLEFPDEYLDQNPGKEIDLTMAEELENSEQWKTLLTREEIQAVETDFRCSKVMKFGGYEFYDFSLDESS